MPFVTELAGAALSEAFYRELVAPLLNRGFPRLRHLAGRLGSGSDVLGLDDARSQDHDWGCRLTLLVDAADEQAIGDLSASLERDLPETFRGRPVRFPVTWNPQPVHQTEIATVEAFIASRLGLLPLSHLDWLCLTGHSVLEAVGGPVFHDTTVAFGQWKSKLREYPLEVEVFNLASAWQKLAQGLAFVGRTAETGQELQSRMLSARLVTVLMQLAFFLERQWIPYPKWTERLLPLAESLTPHLEQAATAKTWHEREDGLCRAADFLAERQRQRGLPAVKPATVPFFDRPYRTVASELTSELLALITDPELKRLPPIGSIELWVDNTDILARPEHRPAVLESYRALIRRRGAIA